MVLACISRRERPQKTSRTLGTRPRRPLAELPVGASQRQSGKVKDTVLAPIKRTIAEREERRREERQQETRRFGAELRATTYLDHIKTGSSRRPSCARATPFR